MPLTYTNIKWKHKRMPKIRITIIEPKLSDGCKIDESMINTADKILCDVPCSGLGIIG